ncbi:MAG: hypothetical protein CMO97_06355 [Woeseia sp.]|nr:hypothetical protein [Woeseia sp.]|tara:strand:- start:96 stop:416 length:321 start_codon:yes stop_codon:yes gene_type:complete
MDNWEQYQKLNEDALIEEIQKINKRLFKIKPGNPMFNQLKNMLQMAEMAYSDKLATTRLKDDKSPSVLEIGNVESTYNEVDYSPEALLNLTVESYTKTLRGKTKKS